MITHIKTKGLKGQDIDEPLAQYQIFIGPNGSGKSSRAQAIALATMGYIPWGSSAKKPGDILKAYGPEEGPLTAAITCNGVELERRLSPTASGASQRLRVNKVTVGPKDFPTELFKAGAPTILDLGAFIGLSGAKKIDTLFSLFPPAGDVAALDGAIEETAKLISYTNKEIGNLEGTIQRISSSRQGLNLPAGTLAEKSAEYDKVRAEYKDLQSKIHAEEVRFAEEKATADAKAKAEGEAKRKAEEVSTLKKLADKNQSMPAEKPYEPFKEKPAVANATAPYLSALESLERVSKAMDLAGCKVCAARLVVKKETQTWRNAQ